MGHLGAPKVHIEIEVRDKEGRLIEKRKEESHSWVANFITALRALMASYDLDDTPNALVTLGGDSWSYPNVTTQYHTILFACAGEGEDLYGILVGAGDTPVTLDDHTLATLIRHGDEAGKLHYNATTVEDLVRTDGGIQFKIVRTFSNNSGGDITVKEVGLAIRCNNVAGTAYILLARDVLASAVTVPNGSTLTVRYIIQHAVS
ncbi:MAG: hypothetical protein DRO39_07805 [Thermoprotei archaeon]|nr:MAG: hypothetical protein DRO39_07805 [Thermoprotei archaeon]